MDVSMVSSTTNMADERGWSWQACLLLLWLTVSPDLEAFERELQLFRLKSQGAAQGLAVFQDESEDLNMSHGSAMMYDTWSNIHLASELTIDDRDTFESQTDVAACASATARGMLG
jgi:hypothetical protein